MVKSLSILLIDDDSIERLKFKRVCDEIRFSCSIKEAVNGKQALDFLVDAKNRFNIIVLDLHMPIMNGLELLEKIKSNLKLKDIPVVIMSNSEDDEELRRCYNLGISGFFTKPGQYSKYSKKVKPLLKYWKQSKLINN